MPPKRDPSSLEESMAAIVDSLAKILAASTSNSTQIENLAKQITINTATTTNLVTAFAKLELDPNHGSLPRRITQIGLWGSSTGGSPWSLQLESNKKLKKITIDHEDWIYSIGFTIEVFSGSSSYSLRHGGSGGWSGGTISEICLDVDEEITEIRGTVGITTGCYANYMVISSLCFVTNKKRNFGPFGKETETPFSVSWDAGSFAGFYGRAGFYLDGFGCYLKATV
ncbi:agglutinin-like [Cynara cardunculus var. scolymus]|uniref:agglutinin-like n=1 Tax=Cynara cardunculus var. scolymus TaxID=59895 RepID=UPI000D62C0AA|nr:agglutinin-like [Cynara cardunculus var. scolymus]